MPSKKAVLYARSATPKSPGDNNSVDIQLEKLRLYAQENDYEVLAEFVDEGVGGNTYDRPAWGKMITMITEEPGIVGTVLIGDYSRLARNREINLSLIELLRENNVTLVPISQPYDESFEIFFKEIYERILFEE